MVGGSASGVGYSWAHGGLELRPQIDKGTLLFTAFALIVLLVGGLLAKHFWTELQGTGDNADNLSTTIRNVMLMIGAFLALPLAIWRGWVAERQVKATNESVSAAHEAISNQRFQAAAQMLGHELHAVRLGAIQTLTSLARMDPNRYYIDAATLLAEFVRHPPSHEVVSVAHVSGGLGFHIREDVRAVMRFVGSRSEEELRYEMQQGYRIDLNHLWLQGMDLKDLNFSRVRFAHARLERCDLSAANFEDADLTYCRFNGTLLCKASFERALLSGANFSGWSVDEDGRYRGRRADYEAQEAIGIVQTQLDEALDDKEDPPKLRDVRDAETGELLSWHGIPPERL